MALGWKPSVPFRMSRLKKSLAGSSWYISEKMVRLTGAFLVSAWVARYLGPEQFGTLAFALSLVGMLGFLGSFGLESLVVRDLVQQPVHEGRIVAAYFALRLLGSFLVPPAALLYVATMHPADTGLLMVTAVISTGVIAASLDVVDCFLQARHQAKSTSLIRAGAFVIAALAKCVLILVGAPLVWFACATVLEFVLIALAYRHVLAKHRIKLSPITANWGQIRRLTRDGKAMILSGLTVIIYSKIDALVVGEAISKQALANYAIAVTMCGAWNMIGTSITQAVAPHISAAKTAGREGYVMLLRHFLATIAALACAGSLALSLLSSWIFDFLLGPAYADGGAIFSVLVWSSVPVFLGVATSQIIVNEHLYWLSLARTTIGMAITTLLVFPVATLYGTVGVAVLVVASSTIVASGILISRTARSTLWSVCTGMTDGRS